MTAPPDLSNLAPTPAPGRNRRWLLLGILLAPILIFGLYAWLVLHWDYSNGYRSGTLQKFSRRGWVCKTYEGELWQSVVANVNPTIWTFTVRDVGVVRELDTLVGKPVRVHYTEHRGVPTSCFGDTPYYVDSVTVVTQ